MEQPTKIIAYYRVSTRMQGASGYGLEAQRAEVKRYAEAHHATIIAEYQDVESGKHDNRPELNKALKRAAKEHGRATLVVAKLDRLSRNAEMLMRLNNEVNAGRLAIVAIDLPIFNTLTIGIFATIAQYERELISQRTKAAAAAKKARGESIGREITAEQRARGQERRRANNRNNPANKRAWAYYLTRTASGVTNLSQIARELNANEYATINGKSWNTDKLNRLQKLMRRAE